MAPISVNRTRATLGQLLEAEVDEVESLAAEARRGVQGPAHYDRMEERAAGIGKRLRAAFRNKHR